MERYEQYSYLDLAELQSAFDAIASTLLRMKLTPLDGSNGKYCDATQEYGDFYEAAHAIGSAIGYGEELIDAIDAVRYGKTDAGNLVTLLTEYVDARTPNGYKWKTRVDYYEATREAFESFNKNYGELITPEVLPALMRRLTTENNHMLTCVIGETFGDLDADHLATLLLAYLSKHGPQEGYKFGEREPFKAKMKQAFDGFYSKYGKYFTPEVLPELYRILEWENADTLIEVIQERMEGE